MPTTKIADLPRVDACRDPDHKPATMVVRSPGTYVHVCSACGGRTVFTVRDRGRLSALDVLGLELSRKLDDRSSSRAPMPYAVHSVAVPDDATRATSADR